jgi:branched-subunit amino acid transport protein
MSAWVALAAAGAVSLGLRCVVVVGLGDRSLPPAVERAASLLAPAVMAAMVATSLTRAVAADLDGTVVAGGSGWIVRLLSVVVGGAIALRTGSVGRALVAGVACFLVLGCLLA